MIIIPAIDLMNGKVVRLTRGDPSTAKYYEQWGTPIQVALKWKSQGAERLHIIDLDATFGFRENTSTIADITQVSGLPVQVGGGIRTVEAAANLLNLGVRHVILGTLAFNNPDAILQLQQKFSANSLIVALDNKGGKVMIQGWKTQTSFTMTEALEKYSGFGVRSFLVTSITEDGMLRGPDLKSLREATEYPDVEIIAAGGVGSLKDLLVLKQIGVEGVVVGKALYEERFTLKKAVEVLEDS